MLHDYIAPYDATVVHKLIRASGSVMMGKTNMDEFAIGSGCMDSYYGPCFNPWKSGLRFAPDADSLPTESVNFDPSDCYVPGGSSGGSAVAVATGSVFAALGSDTGGSTRYPAALTGIVGFKPTYGLLSRYGLVPLSHSLDTIGILTRSAEDAQHVFDQLRGFDEMDSTSVPSDRIRPFNPDLDLSSIKFGVSDDYLVPGMSSEVVDLVKEMCNRLSNAGAKVVNVSLPHTKYATSCYTILNAAEIASNFACFDGTEYGFRVKEEVVSGGKRLTREQLYELNRSEGFGDPVKGRIHAGNYFLLKENYVKFVKPAHQMRRLIWSELMQVLSHDEADECVDVILTPITRGTAHRCSEWITRDNRELAAQEDFCTQPANLSGLPAITIPCILSPNTGLPLGVQLIASPLEDNLLLSVGMQLQRLVNFPSLKFHPST